MGFSFKGYVLEPPRVGQANSSFTSSPNNFVSDDVAFAAIYPLGSEPSPRAEYLVLVLGDGSLADGTFGWTKNEVLRRFDYDGRDQTFKPLPGGALIDVGVVDSTINTLATRLKVPPPVVVASPAAAAPYRLSVGSGSGTQLATSLVLAFGSPSVGTVEILRTTGQLNWNPADLVTYVGQHVRFQRQSFYGFAESSGLLDLSSDALLLNPLPATGQVPLIRAGFSLHLIADEVPNEGSFSGNPPSGHVEWARTTGRLKFNSTLPLNSIYYDGVLMATGLQLPRQTIGTITSPDPIVGLPVDGGDIIFRVPGVVQFPQQERVSQFNPNGKFGVVQIQPVGSTGLVEFSFIDKILYAGQPVEVIFGDLLIERGVSMRFFRTPVNLNGADPTIKDITNVYTTTNATLADPIIGSPQVFLPAIPIDDPVYPITVHVEQGTGLFPPGVFPRLDVLPLPTGPGPTYGYILDLPKRIFQYAQRKNNVLVTIPQLAGAIALPDPLVLTTNFLVSLETGVGTGIYTPLTLGLDAILEATSGVVNFTTTQGTSITSGSTASFSGTTFTDTAGDFSAVHVGDTLSILSGINTVYTVAALISGTSFRTDLPGSGSGLSYEIHRSREVLADRFFQEAVLIDPNTKVERVRSLGPIQNLLSFNLVGLALGTFPDLSTFEDLTTDFINIGVQPGYTLTLASGPDAGSRRIVRAVSQFQLTVEVDFISVTAASYGLGRRLHIPRSAVQNARFRFGANTFSTSVVLVPKDSNFTDPSLIPQGQVEISQETGNLNFSDVDIAAGQDVYWVNLLTQGRDYKIQSGFGLVEFTDRFLALEEALITYTPLTGDGPAPSSITERATFLVRKEIAQDHPSPVSTVFFNPLGRSVASNPVPGVYRGGRPQKIGTQVLVDVAASSVTFLADEQVTEALPHGSVLEPDERVYVDYFVYEAIGGEKSVTVLQPPMFVVQVSLEDGATSFDVIGDQTTVFPAGYLLRVETERVFLLESSTYNAPTNLTTVTLSSGSDFQETLTGPKLYVSSGPIRVQPAVLFSSYFVTELTPYEPVARGMNKVYIPGDRAGSYRTGSILLFTDGLSSFLDFYQVTGALLNEFGKTEITLSSNVLRQYTPGIHALKVSARPILEASAKKTLTSRSPVLTQPYSVYRRIEGQVGHLLTQLVDYTLDESGQITFSPPLQAREEITLFYTGYRLVQAGLRLQASYTTVIAPDDVVNGLVNQSLQMDYSIYSADSFYYRVETRTNFRIEVAKSISDDAKAASPSGGPNLSNTAASKLYDQGRESVFFSEGHIANEDLVAQVMLKHYNDATNYLEDVLRDLDGRVIGCADGRFIFDGKLDNPLVPLPPLAQVPPGPLPQPPKTLSASTNQIDDQVLLTPFPLDLSGGLIPFTFTGTWVPVFNPGPLSRFYPTVKSTFGITISGKDTNAQVQDEILDLGAKNLTGVQQIRRRSPRARILKPAQTGSSTFYTTDPNATDTLLRPAFVVGQAVDIIAEDGTPLHVNIPPNGLVPPLIVITSIGSSPDTITIGFPTTVDIPAGATITAPLLEPGYPNPPYTPVGKIYTIGLEFLVNFEKGTLLYPFDMSLFGIPSTPPNANERIQAAITLSNSLTEPLRFPALDGIALDDDGDESIPLVSPSFESELGLLGFEQDYVGTGSPSVGGILQNPLTTPPYVGTGSLNVAKTIITAAVNFPSPVPQMYDLVRITGGLNGSTSYRRITAVGANTVTVDTAFTTQDAGFPFTITVSNRTTVSGFLVSSVGNVMTDTTADFTTGGVRAGYTVVITSGVSAGDRRQIVSFTTNDLAVDHPFTTDGVILQYRIDDALNTFSDLAHLTSSLTAAKALILTNVAPALPAITPVNSEKIAIEAFFEYVLTDLLSPITQVGTAAGTVLTGTTDFVAAGVQAGDLVYIPTDGNGNDGFYKVVNPPPTTTTLNVDVAFATNAAVSFRVTRAFGVTIKKSFSDLFTILKNSVAYAAGFDTFNALVQATVPVVVPGPVVDPNMYANSILPSDVLARGAVVDARLTGLTDPSGPINTIQNILKSIEKLYDKRYAWLDARLNLTKGYLPKKARAVTDRQKTQLELVKQLYKILATQGGG